MHIPKEYKSYCSKIIDFIVPVAGFLPRKGGGIIMVHILDFFGERFRFQNEALMHLQEHQAVRYMHEL